MWCFKCVLHHHFYFFLISFCCCSWFWSNTCKTYTWNYFYIEFLKLSFWVVVSEFCWVSPSILTVFLKNIIFFPAILDLTWSSEPGLYVTIPSLNQSTQLLSPDTYNTALFPKIGRKQHRKLILLQCRVNKQTLPKYLWCWLQEGCKKWTAKVTCCLLVMFMTH